MSVAQARQASARKRDIYVKLQLARAQSSGLYPLSNPQLAMWYQQALAPQSTAYNMPFGICLSGELGAEASRPVQLSLRRVIERQSALRSTFVLDGDEPLQRIGPSLEPALGFQDISSEVGPDWQSIVQERLRRQAARPFDLIHGPLYRFALLKVSGDLHVLVATFHHIVMDGWSLGVFLEDFSRCFLEELGGDPAELRPLATTYQRAVIERRADLVAADLADSLGYWQQRLKDAPSGLSLPADYRRTDSAGARGGVHAVAVDADTVSALNRIGSALGATAFMTTICAYFVFLARVCRQSDIVLGVSVANRDSSQLHDLIGLFSDILPMRFEVRSGQSFASNLKALLGTCSSDLDHAQVPMTKIIEAVRPQRSALGATLFEAGFDYQNTPWPDFLGDHISVLNGDPGTARLDLNLNFSRVDKAAVALFEYNRDRFTESTMAALGSAFACLLKAITLDPDQAVSKLTLGPPREAFAGAETLQCGPQSSIVGRIAAVAQQTPRAAALEYHGERISYAQLMVQVGRVRSALAEVGVKPGDTVGLQFGREPGYVVSLLAALASGIRFCPLDEDLPAGRLSELIAASAARVVIGADRLCDGLRGCCQQVVAYSQALAAEAPLEEPLADATADAYLMFTSGSTGAAKGVIVPHSALASFCADAQQNFGWGSADRILQFASIAFDTSFEEILPALCSGSCVVYRTPPMVGSVQAMVEECSRLGLSVLNLPTALWHDWVEVLAQDEDIALPATVHTVIIGGEAAQPEKVATWQRRIGTGVRLLNTYGPTETTVSVTCVDLAESAVEPTPLAVSLGTANSRVRLDILDEHGQPLPVGLPGEICIAGTVLAKGYLGRPELTRQQFPQLVRDDGTRIRYYRSGDLGRIRSDGSIECRGRIDNQLKIRGHRVELAEIEHLLRGCPDVSEAIAIGRQNRDQGLDLVVCVAGVDGVAVAERVERWMDVHLPHYMRPAQLYCLSAIPRTVSGKLDRQALLGLQQSRRPEAADGPAPSNDIEQFLLSLWEELLGQRIDGPQANFFRLGGHSLLMIRMLSRIRARFAVELSLGTAFAQPTIAAMAAAIQAQRDSQPQPEPDMAPSPPLDEHSRSGVYPLSMAQQRLWFLAQLDPADTAYNNPSATVVVGEMDGEALLGAVQDVVARHEVLRSRFHSVGGELQQRVHAPEQFNQCAYTDLSRLQGEQLEAEVARHSEAVLNSPFDLATSFPLRVAVLRLSPDRHQILINWHHIATDAWSLRLFTRELAIHYQHRIGRAAPPELPPAAQFGDYAAWEAQRLQQPEYAVGLRHWCTHLAGAPERVLLPAGRVRPDAPGGRSIVIREQLDETLTEALLGLAAKQQTTLFVVCLGLFKLLLARVSGQTDLVVGTPISTRSEERFESSIGYFINTLALRTQLQSAQSLAEVIERVRTTVVAAYAHREVPFEWVVAELGGARDDRASPLFNVLFALENEERSPLLSDQQGVLAIAHANPHAKFDLSLSVRLQGGTAQIEWEAKPGFVDQAGLLALAQNYVELLHGAVADFQRPLDSLGLAPHSELCEALLVDAAGDDRSLCERVEAVAAADPTRVALICPDIELSYAGFVAAYHHLAGLMAVAAERKQSRVALLLRGHSPIPVAVYAAWRAGAAYVPLDPAHPFARLEQLYALSGADAIICSRDTVELARRLCSRLWIVEEAIEAASSQAGPHSLSAQSHPAPDDLAYVLYTSGSTGEPKGVMVEHAQLLHFCASFAQRAGGYGIDASGRWTANPPYTFDMSVFDYLRLCSGDTLLMIDGDTRRDPEALLAFMRRNRVDVVGVTPTQMQMLLASCPGPGSLPSVVVAGEAISTELWDSIVAHYAESGSWAINLYGPTEATMGTSTALIAKDPDAPSIGTPLPGYRCRLLDVFGGNAEPGIPGELQIAGPGLARGYLNQPELTAQQFAARADARGQTERWYRSGDLALCTSTGQLKFLGRADGQVKIRGQRIELGEVASCLRRLEGVRDAAVIQCGSASEARLIGFVTPAVAGIESADAEHLRQRMRELLPDYMVPTRVRWIAALPLGAHGKLDRDALQRLAVLPEVEAPLERPAAHLDQLLGICARLLGRAQVRPEENFFDLGGHSLLIVRLAAELEQLSGTRPALKSLFNAASLNDIALLLADQALPGADQSESAEVEEFQW